MAMRVCALCAKNKIICVMCTLKYEWNNVLCALCDMNEIILVHYVKWLLCKSNWIMTPSAHHASG